MNQYFPKPYISNRDIKVEADLSNSAKKADAKQQQLLIHHRSLFVEKM